MDYQSGSDLHRQRHQEVLEDKERSFELEGLSHGQKVGVTVFCT